MAIGISRERVTAPSVWCELFQQLDVTALEQALGGWVQGEAPSGHVAIDGKRLRGSATAHAPGTHLLAAFSDRLQSVIGQLRVDPDANEIAAFLEEAGQHTDGIDELREGIAMASSEAGGEEVVCRAEIIGDSLELSLYAASGRFLDSITLPAERMPAPAEEMLRVIATFVRLVRDAP